MDNVNHPSHYNRHGVETIDMIKTKLTKEEYIGFLKGNIIKYLDRYEFKNGEEDLKKAQWYANELIALVLKYNLAKCVDVSDLISNIAIDLVQESFDLATGKIKELRLTLEEAAHESVE